jgi:O-antigen ligase/cytochrome c-type biogenesis protein CcmH/NrfG
MTKRFALYSLLTLLGLSLITPFLVSRELLFPFVTTKAFYLRSLVELGLPFYLFLVVADKRYRPDLKNFLHISVLAFLIINFVSAWFGVNPARSLWGNFERMGGVYLTFHLTLLYFYAVLIYQAEPKLLERVFKLFVVLSGVLAVYGLLVALGMKPFVPDPSLPRISITFGNPIYVGSYMILPMFLAGFFALQSERVSGKVGFWLLSLVQFLAIFQSGTRGALVALVLGVFVCGWLYLVLSKDKKQKIFGLGIAGFVGVLVLGIYLFNNSLPSGFTMKRITNLRDVNAQSRLLQWKAAAEGFYDRPVLGTGPENYYVVANLYHNPEMFKYDKSWFDKPHNYLLEILVTTGVLGFAAYAAMAGFAAYGFWLAFRREVIGLAEALFLFGGLLVYQLQNLFVFDNIASSLGFYLFLGLAAFMLQVSLSKQSEKKNKTDSLSPIFLQTLFGLSSVAAVLLLVYSNFLPMKAARGVNYGFAYATVDFATSDRYFKENSFGAFNLDPGETAVKYSDSVLSAMRSSKSSSEVYAALEVAIEKLERAAVASPDYPIYWYKLANLYFVKAYVDKTPYSEKGEEALDKAVQLAPNRMEARMLRAQIRLAENRVSDAKNILNEIFAQYPTAADPKWLYLMALRTEGKAAEAVSQYEKWRQDPDFIPRSPEDVDWVVSFYLERGELEKTLPILEQLEKASLLNIEGRWLLAQTYAELKKPEQALEMAKVILRADPSQKEKAEEFVKNLRGKN